MACLFFSCRLSKKRLRGGFLALSLIALPALLGLQADGVVQKAAAEESRTPHQIDQEHTLYYGVLLPRERKVTRALNLAEELIQDRRYAEGIAILVQVLTRETDAITDTSASAEEEPVAVSQRIERLIAALPPAGRRAYELEVDAKATRLFASALGPPLDREKVVALLSRYPKTNAAGEAMWQLARYHLDRNQPEIAAAYLQKLGLSGQSQYEPQRTLLQAVCLLQVGQTEEAERALEDLPRSSEAGGIIIAGQTYAAAQTGLILSALQQAGLQPSSGQWLTREAWLGRDGNHRRTASKATDNDSQVHLWPTWSARGSVQPEFHEAVAVQQQFRGSQGRPTLFVGSALGVGEQIIFRTPDQLIGLDWSTGKRIWTSRTKSKRSSDTRTSEEIASVNQRLRLWYDQPLAALSSDGRHVFMIQPAQEKVEKPRAGRVRFGGFPRRREAGESASWNTLSAYELSSEGKLKWTTSGKANDKAQVGSAGDEEQLLLSEAYFTEAPLWAEGGLYVVAEIDQTLHFCELEPTTGKLKWSQPLASVNRGVHTDTRRRLAGTMTAIANGVAVCSTGAGLVVGVDLTDRTLKWFYRFPINEGYRPPRSSPWRSTNDENWSSKLSQSWLENQVRIVSSAGQTRVVVASPESDQLHCVDLMTGDSLWTSKGKPEDVLLSAATPDGIVITGTHEVRGMNLETGAATWRYGLPTKKKARKTLASGRGLVLGSEYLLPIVSEAKQQAVRFNITTGEVVQTINSHGGKLGNLIRYRQGVISQTEVGVQRFDDLMGSRIAAEQSPDLVVEDSTQLCKLGEVAFDQGETSLALRRFSDARRLDPQSLLAKSRLRIALLAKPVESLTDDERGLLLELVASAPSRLRLILQRMASLIDSDDEASFAPLLRSAYSDIGQTDALLKVEEGYYVQGSGWLLGLLQQAKQTGRFEDEIGQFQKLIRREAFDSPDVTSLRRYCGLFADDRKASEELKQRLLARETSGASLVAARLGSQGGRDASAAASDSLWSTRQVEVTTVTNATENNRRSSRQALARSVLLINPKGEKPEVQVALQRDSQALQLRDRHGDLINRIALERDGVELARRFLKNQSVEVWHVAGHLFFGYDGKILAYDLRQGPADSDRLIWKRTRDNAANKLPPSSSTTGTAAFRKESALSAAEANRQLARGTLLMASPHAVMVGTPLRLLGLEPETGALLWSRPFRRGKLAPIAWGSQVYVTDKRQKGFVFSQKDGRLLEEWGPLEASDGSVVAALGTTALTQQRRGLVTTIRLVNLASGSLLHQHEFEAMPEFLVAGKRVLVCSLDGKLQSYDLEQGALEYEREVAIPPTTKQLTLTASRGRFFIACNERTSSLHRDEGIFQMDEVAPVTGPLFAFELADGKASWGRPLQLEGQAVLARQPAACPLLVLGARRDRLSSSKGGRALQLAFVDLATGCLVHSAVVPNETASGVHRIYSQSGPNPEVQLSLPQTTIVLRVADAPARPRPPYDAAFDKTTRKEDSGLLGVGTQIRRLFDGSIQKSPPTREKAIPAEADDD